MIALDDEADDAPPALRRGTSTGTLEFEGFYGKYRYELRSGTRECSGDIELLQTEDAKATTPPCKRQGVSRTVSEPTGRN